MPETTKPECRVSCKLFRVCNYDDVLTDCVSRLAQGREHELDYWAVMRRAVGANEDAGQKTHNVKDLWVSIVMESRSARKQPRLRSLRDLVAGAGTLVELFPASRPRAEQSLDALYAASLIESIYGDWCRIGGDIARSMRKSSGGQLQHDRECTGSARDEEGK